RVSRSEAAVPKRLVRMVPGSARNSIAVKTINNPVSTKNENKKYDNSTVTWGQNDQTNLYDAPRFHYRGFYRSSPGPGDLGAQNVDALRSLRVRHGSRKRHHLCRGRDKQPEYERRHDGGV